MPFFSRWTGRSPPAKERSPPATGRSPPDPYDLDQPLLYFSPHDPWTIRDACEGTQIFGSIGGGKTSGSGKEMARSFLRAGFGGLVLCAKPEERQLWERYAKETGREKHLVIISPDHPWRYNFLDAELRREGRGGGLTENLVGLLSIATELVEGKVEQSGDGAFWTRAMREMLRNAIDILAQSGLPLTLDNICKLIADAAQSLAEVSSETWQENSFCAECIRLAEQKPKDTRAQHDFETAVRYWLRSYPSLSDRTRAGIVATFTSVADILLHGVAWELFSTETTIVPDVTWQDGAVIVIDLPIQEYGEVGRICQGLFKILWQKAVLRRDVKFHPRPVFLWADEAQNFISSFDFQFQAVARSARACTTFLTQNRANYLAVLGKGGREETDSFLGNLVTKIFHSQSDASTNSYAAELIAQEITTSFSFNSGANDSGMSRSSGGSETLRYRVLPGEFGILRKGGQQNNFCVDAIIFQGGRVFRGSGATYLRTTFKQS